MPNEQANATGDKGGVPVGEMSVTGAAQTEIGYLREALATANGAYVDADRERLRFAKMHGELQKECETFDGVRGSVVFRHRL